MQAGVRSYAQRQESSPTSNMSSLAQDTFSSLQHYSLSYYAETD
jgi:hypothetical protein